MVSYDASCDTVEGVVRELRREQCNGAAQVPGERDALNMLRCTAKIGRRGEEGVPPHLRGERREREGGADRESGAENGESSREGRHRACVSGKWHGRFSTSRRPA